MTRRRFYFFIYSFSGCCFVCFLWLKILNLLLSLWHSQQQELEIRCQVYRLWTALASVCETSVWYVPISRWCTLSLRRKGVFKSLNAVEILTKKNIQQSSIFTSSCPQYHKIICSSHWPWSLFLRECLSLYLQGSCCLFSNHKAYAGSLRQCHTPESRSGKCVWWI